MTKNLRCRACGISFPSKGALKQHNRAKHRVRGLATMASFFFVAIAFIVVLVYSGVYGWLSQAFAPPLAHQGQIVMHIHPRIEIFVDGQRVTMPANIGINSKLWNDRSLERYGMAMPNMREMPYMSPLHTHDTSGIVHVESTVNRDYMLGEFFDVWGVRFTESCILDRCSEGGIVMLVNGVRSYEFRNHVLKDGEQIRIEFKRT